MLTLKKIGINTYKEAVIYMRSDCEVCRAEGFEVHARVKVTLGANEILATLNTIENGFLAPNEVALSNYAWHLLGAHEGAKVRLSHPEPLTSFSYVRSKIFGNVLKQEELNAIIDDMTQGRYSDIEIASFLAACAGGRLNPNEILNLTKAMVLTGKQLHWDVPTVVDKHSIGGLPGNRTTPIVVPIVTSFGLMMPKTSSRAITSPAGTADVMETMTEVELSLKQMRKVVEQELGCIVWGGAVTLSPADDILITVERALELDSEGQLIASVLSKKIAAGSTHVFIDIPVGPTAKVRTSEAGLSLRDLFLHTAQSLNLHLEINFSDGQQPVGYGIGPSLEAQDVMAILQNDPNAPNDLREKSLTMASVLIHFSKKLSMAEARRQAEIILESGQAWKKFQAICEAQGGLKQPPKAHYSYVFEASCAGQITGFDNRKISRVAKLAGAPIDKAAGIYLHKKLYDDVKRNEPLFTLYSESKGELNYARKALESMQDCIEVTESRH